MDIQFNGNNPFNVLSQRKMQAQPDKVIEDSIDKQTNDNKPKSEQPSDNNNGDAVRVEIEIEQDGTTCHLSLKRVKDQDGDYCYKGTLTYSDVNGNYNRNFIYKIILSLLIICDKLYYLST